MLLRIPILKPIDAPHRLLSLSLPHFFERNGHSLDSARWLFSLPLFICGFPTPVRSLT